MTTISDMVCPCCGGHALLDGQVWCGQCVEDQYAAAALDSLTAAEAANPRSAGAVLIQAIALAQTMAELINESPQSIVTPPASQLPTRWRAFPTGALEQLLESLGTDVEAIENELELRNIDDDRALQGLGIPNASEQP